MESIVSDHRAEIDVDETAVDDTFPVASCDPPADEMEETPPVVELAQGDEPAPVAPEWDSPSVPADRPPFPVEGEPAEVLQGLEARLQEAQAELRTLRDDCRQVTDDRDDLARRLELAAVEFDRLNQEADDARQESGAAREALMAARAALAEAQEQAGAAGQERAAALAQAARAEANERRARGELETLEGTVRQVQAARAAGAQRQRVRLTAGAAALAFVAVAFGYAVGRAASPARPEQHQESMHAPIAAAASGAPAPTRASPAPAVPAVPAAPAWPTIRDSRLTVREEPGALVILFNEPLFARGSELTPAARQDLRRLATLLKPYVTAYRIEVEGHTDASTVAGGQAYGSNRELGLTRARAALDVLVKAGGLPAASFSISSAGDATPLVPGESQDARRRNRTVAIKLHGLGAQ